MSEFTPAETQKNSSENKLESVLKKLEKFQSRFSAPQSKGFHNEEERNELSEKGKSRRAFMKRAALTTAGAALGYWGAKAGALTAIPELGTALPAAAERTTATLSAELSNQGETMLEPSEEAIQASWENYYAINKAQNFMTKEAWMQLGRSMGIFANLYYAKEKQSNESFDQYYERFIGSMVNKAKEMELDPEIFPIAMDYSARFVIKNWQGQRNDVLISAGQAVGGALARRFGIETDIQDLLNEKGTSLPIDKLGYATPLGPRTTIRLFSTGISTGMQDYEIEKKAKALYQSASPTAIIQFENKYPQMAERYRQLLFVREQVDINRAELQNHIEGEDGFIDKYGDVALAVFFDEKSAEHAFAEIGIGENTDPWQKYNYTRVWANSDYRYEQNDLEISRKVIEQYKDIYTRNSRHAYSLLMREQIRNPKFIDYLKRSAIKRVGNLKEISTEVDSIDQITLLLSSLEEKKEDMIRANQESLATEGALEYSSDYQLTTSAAIVKGLLSDVEKVVGRMDRRSKDTIAYYSYGISQIREMGSHMDLVTSGTYARDPTIDLPYEQGNRLAEFLHATDLIKKATGIDPRDNFKLMNGVSKSALEQLTDEAKAMTEYLYMRVKPVDSGVWSYYSQNPDTMMIREEP